MSSPGIDIDVLFGMRQDRIIGDRNRAPPARQLNKSVACRNANAAGRRDHIKNPVALGRQRNARTGGHLATHRDSVAQIFGNRDDDLRLDRLVRESIDDFLFDFGRGKTGNFQPSRIGNLDRTVAGNDLLRNGRGSRSSRDRVFVGSCREQAAGGRFPNGHDHRIANADAQIGRRPAGREYALERFPWLRRA